MGRVSRLVEKYELLAQQQPTRCVVNQSLSSCSSESQMPSTCDAKVQDLSTKHSLSSPVQEDKNNCTTLKVNGISQVNVAIIEKKFKQGPSALATENSRLLTSTMKVDKDFFLMEGIEDRQIPSFLKKKEYPKTTLAVDKANHYFFILNEVDEHRLAQLLKTIDSAICLEKKPGKLHGLLKNKEGAVYFKNMLVVAEDAMRHDKLVALALLQRMKSNEWAKSVMRFHSTLKSHHQVLYQHVVGQVVKDSGYLFAEIIHQIDRQELFNHIQGRDKTDYLSQACPHLARLACLWNQIKFTIINEVLKEEEVKQRTAVIELFIRVAYQALESHDFSTTAAVWDSLQCESIQENRLKMSWLGLSKESTKMYHILSEKLDKICSDINEKDMKRMVELSTKTHSIPLLNPYLATLVMAKEHQKDLSHQILEEEKKLREDVAFFNTCKTLKREERIKDKIEELGKELKTLQRGKNKKASNPDLVSKIEIVASRLKLAQTIYEMRILPSDKELLSGSIHLKHIQVLEKGIEKYDRQMNHVIEVILKLVDQMGRYLRNASYYDTSSWICRRHFSIEEWEKIEKQAYQRSLKLEPLRP